MRRLLIGLFVGYPLVVAIVIIVQAIGISTAGDSAKPSGIVAPVSPAHIDSGAENLDAASQADRECTPIRLDSPGGPMEHVPVYDQAVDGLCYAYAASMMIDAWRFAHGDSDESHLTSPLSLGVLFRFEQGENYLLAGIPAVYRKEQGLNVGDSFWTTYYGLQFGSCSSERTKENLSGRELHGKTNRLLDAYENPRAYFEFLRDRPGAIEKTLAEFNLTETESSEQELRNKVSFALDEPNYFGYLYHVVATMCTAPHLKAVIPQAAAKMDGLFRGYLMSEHQERMRAAINRNLDADIPVPILLSICGGVLIERGYIGLGSKHNKPKVACKKGDAHSILVIGRRQTASGRCELLLRNTWGGGCDRYRGLWECEENRGNVWIDQESLYSNTIGAFWLAELDGGSRSLGRE